MSNNTINSKFIRPAFKHMVRCVSSSDSELFTKYWLFDNFHVASVKACSLSILHHQTFDIMIPKRNLFGEYRAYSIFRFHDGECEDIDVSDRWGLHWRFYMDMGECEK